ncbi:hypothetical protein [Kaistella sp.]|uniref:hypothetical protein n=1 Tax=Kaistella sp. TaxID=2782235 RepID=UPI002F942F37
MVDFTEKEKSLIVKALKLRKEHKEEDDNDVEELLDELQKQNVFLSRYHLNYINGCLNNLLDFNRDPDIFLLQEKLEDLDELP